MIALNLSELGFAVTDPIISHDECNAIIAELENVSIANVGSRALLKLHWCSELAVKLRTYDRLSSYFYPNQVAIQCTYFEKSTERNWLVPLHQDLSVPVAEKIDYPKLKLWSVKEGMVFVQPPIEILDQLTAVRLHLDECTVEDGALRVVPSSHQSGILETLSDLRRQDDVLCPVQKGGTLIMKPLILHASSKSSGHSKRRVLHFLFAPPVLPFGLRWKYYV
jgi:hypothetical protein